MYVQVFQILKYNVIRWSSSQKQYGDHFWIVSVSNAFQGDSMILGYPDIQWSLVVKPKKNTNKKWVLKIHWK